MPVMKNCLLSKMIKRAHYSPLNLCGWGGGGGKKKGEEKDRQVSFYAQVFLRNRYHEMYLRLDSAQRLERLSPMEGKIKPFSAISILCL